MGRRVISFVSVVVMFFMAMWVDAFVVEIRQGDTESAILQRYPGLSGEMLREANPSVNFKQYLIAGDSLEIPFVPAHELYQTKARVAELEVSLESTRTELTTTQSELATATVARDVLAIERDTLKPIADSVTFYRRRTRQTSVALVILSILGGIGIGSLRSGIRIEKEAKYRAFNDVERQKKEIIKLQKSSSNQPPKKVVVHEIMTQTPGQERVLALPRRRS